MEQSILVHGRISDLPTHLRGRELCLRRIDGRPALRNLFRQWLREDPDYYYSALYMAERIYRQSGKSPLITISLDQLDAKVAEAAIEILWLAERAKSSRFRDQVNKARAAWEEDRVKNPGPDKNFGLAPEIDNPSIIKVLGTGSAQGDETAWLAALKLSEAYSAALEVETRLQKDRGWYERHLKRIERLNDVIDGKSATPIRLPSGQVITSDGMPAKRKRKSVGKCSSNRTVCPPSSSSPETTNTLPRQWRTLSLEQKCGLMAQSIESEGRGLSITINLAPEVVRSAQAATKGPVSHLRERFAKVLKRSLGHVPDFVIVAEQGYGQKPHLHGVIDLEDTPENRKAIRHAGEVLSGLALDGPGRARIVDIQPLANGGFWPGDYTKKFRHSTRRQMRVERVMAHTRSLGQRARERLIEADPESAR